MAAFADSFRGETYALFRIVTGFLFSLHGTQKLLGFPKVAPKDIPEYVRLGAGSIELVGGALIMIGLFTRSAAFLASGLMAFAYWLAHGGRVLEGTWLLIFPIMNKGELAALYCFAFLCIATHGGGMWSIDSIISRSSGSAKSD